MEIETRTPHIKRHREAKVKGTGQGKRRPRKTQGGDRRSRKGSPLRRKKPKGGDSRGDVEDQKPRRG